LSFATMLPIPSTSRCVARQLHSSAARLNRVAPPHPISHIRPIIYDDSPAPAPPTLLRHPYSLDEFANALSAPVDLDLQFKLQRQQLDSFHHEFWLDNNIRYFAAKETVLHNLQDSATSLDKENALSEFNRHWYNQEKARTDSYTSEWRRRNFALIRLAAKVEWQKFAGRFTKVFGSTSNTPAS